MASDFMERRVTLGFDNAGILFFYQFLSLSACSLRLQIVRIPFIQSILVSASCSSKNALLRSQSSKLRKSNILIWMGFLEFLISFFHRPLNQVVCASILYDDNSVMS